MTLTPEVLTGLFDYAAQPKDPTACPVCGTWNPSAPRTDRYGYAVGWSACACGLGYLNPRMTAAGYRALYQGPYRRLFAAWRDVSYPAEQLERHQRVWGAGLGWRLKQWGVRGGSLFDVGGSTGAVAQGIGQVLKLSRVTVLDPSGPELERARAKGYETIQADAEEMPPVAPHDLVICTQTLDHLREPLTVLRWLRGCGTRLWVDIALSAIKIDHPCVWNPSSLKRALFVSGWTIDKLVEEKLSKHGGAWCV